MASLRSASLPTTTGHSQTRHRHSYSYATAKPLSRSLPLSRPLRIEAQKDASSLFATPQQDDIVVQMHEMLHLLRAKRKNGSKGGGGGAVYLVGTGPGDPELLTLKAVRLMQIADLVLYDRLVSTHILDMIHSSALCLYVGKSAGYHTRTQDEIHQLLLSFAEAGATVVRLKGGDPLMFGRGGEEMDFLQQQGIEVKVVPGITAASGIAAELGIPLTHRGVANSVRFLTGHSRKGGTDPLFVAEHAADPESTLVIYMGLATLPALANKLVSCGLSPGTPAAAVERGTTSQQRMIFAELQNLPDERFPHIGQQAQVKGNLKRTYALQKVMKQLKKQVQDFDFTYQDVDRLEEEAIVMAEEEERAREEAQMAREEGVETQPEVEQRVGDRSHSQEEEEYNEEPLIRAFIKARAAKERSRRGKQRQYGH